MNNDQVAAGQRHRIRRAPATTGVVRQFWKTRLVALARVATAALALLGAGGVATVHAQQNGEKIVIRESFPGKTASFWPHYVAIAQGYYAREGIDFQIVLLDPTILVTSLIGGSVEISYADASQLVYSIEKGAQVLAIGLSNDKQPYRLMSVASAPTFKDLKGKKIGATAEVDVYTYVIKELLKKNGLEPEKDINWIYGGNQARRVQSLVSGAIDAGLVSPPNDSRLKKEGFHDLAFTPDFYPGLTLSAEAVRRDWAQKNGDTLRHVLRAEADAVKWLNDPANKEKAIEILMTETEAKRPDVEEAYAYYIGTHVWTDACIHPPGLVKVVTILTAMKQLTATTEADVPKFADTQWCAK